MALPGETEAGSAGKQPCPGIVRRAHRDDDHGRGNERLAPTLHPIGSKDPDALKIPARRAASTLTRSVRSPVLAEPAQKMRLWIVGDGPLRGELESFVRIHSLPVRFLGFVNQNEMPAVYASADCLVLPSNGEETWGLVVNEAFACGLPAIVSGEAGCAPELITEGRTGWTMRTPDADELAGLFRKAAEEAPGLPRENIEAVTESAGYRAGTRLLLEVVQGLRGVPR